MDPNASCGCLPSYRRDQGTDDSWSFFRCYKQRWLNPPSYCCDLHGDVRDIFPRPCRVVTRGNTPLHRAALSNSLDNVEALLDLGAIPLIKNTAGFTPLEASSPQYYALRKVLRQAEQGATGQTPLVEAGKIEFSRDQIVMRRG